ncbi:hypothetical protein PpBr36_01887 [Pyricularia pennisetigena]|uniref:hypothetical protein n=1 Tax=Pyricularia pennisetigena TaxID=1578925 RepID=UPI00114F61D2|nr:hypothetical protein PpBr36_01887 [Pyricularia pennisetigena]TLS28643.1 hypothetical protein PpBr36_01887 [Pyricularia pennisetigena]
MPFFDPNLVKFKHVHVIPVRAAGFYGAACGSSRGHTPLKHPGVEHGRRRRARKKKKKNLTAENAGPTSRELRMAEQQQQPAQGTPPKTSAASASSAAVPPGYTLFPGRIPAPLQRLFARFPLYTYPANDLPARCPRPRESNSSGSSSLPTLYVFISDEDAAKGRPSFNPTCLKWQTFLRIAGVEVQILPSTNHASPTGALPFLLPPSSPTPIPASKLQAYAAAATKTNNTSQQNQQSEPPTTSTLTKESEALYTSLVDHPIRRAWLHALYLDPANTQLLTSLYLSPASRSALAQRALHAQLRAAAHAELAASHNGVDSPAAETLRADAARAFASLSAELLPEDDGGRDARPWFAGPAGPGLLDAAVFAYTHLLLSLPWGDRSLAEALVAEAPALVDHRDRMLERLWGVGVRAEDCGASVEWEKV